MRSALPLLLVLCAAFPPGMRADDPSAVNASRQNTQLSPGPGNTATRLTPGNADNQLPFKRDDRVQNHRFASPGLLDKKMDPVGERRAPFDVTETHDKNIIERKDYPKPAIIDRKLSPDNREMFYAQPGGDMDRQYNLVSKYQSRMTDADNASAQRQLKFEKRTTFDKVNRFVFHRNGPGENGTPVVTPAGGGTTSTVSGGPQQAASAPPPPRLQSADTTTTR